MYNYPSTNTVNIFFFIVPVLYIINISENCEHYFFSISLTHFFFIELSRLIEKHKLRFFQFLKKIWNFVYRLNLLFFKNKDISGRGIELTCSSCLYVSSRISVQVFISYTCNECYFTINLLDFLSLTTHFDVLNWYQYWCTFIYTFSLC